MNDNLAEVEVEEEVELDQEETEEVELGEDGEPIEKAEIEPWMQEEDEWQDSPRMVSEAAIIKAKRKLKGRLADQKAESDTEIEKLRAEIEALKAGKVATPTARPKRPKESDFDTDEAYEAAMDVYEDSLLQTHFERAEQTKTIQTTQTQAKEALEKSVDDHYTRGVKLQENKGISPEAFAKADNTVRAAIEAIRPGQGDLLADQLIQTLEEGSEMVMYNLGINKSRRAELVSALASDPSGLKAVSYLAGLNTTFKLNTKPRQSQAPAPAKEVEGDAPVSPKAGPLKKKHDAAMKKGNLQEVFNIRKEGRKAGIDVKGW